MYDLLKKLVRLLAQANVFVQARMFVQTKRHYITSKSVPFK